ncbi:MAG: ABC transporter ATP-binding protein [Proteobacteria bacterium]|nr:ABC transporter ATP-binding protein [Pseudomonadota bacterium]
MVRLSKIATDEKAEKIYDARLMKRFLRYTLPYKGLLFLSLSLLPAISLLALVQPYIIKVAVDNNMVPRVTEGMGLLVLFFTMAVVTEVLIRMFHYYVVQSLGQKVVYSIRKELFNHIQKLSLSYFEKTPVGSLLNRVTNDVESLSEMVSSGVVSLMGDIITIVGIAAVMIILNLKLALVSFSILPLLLVGTLLIRKGMRKVYREIRIKLAEISAFIQENVAGIKVIQLYLREKKNEENFQKINGAYFKATLRANFFDAFLFSFVEIAGAFAVALILWYGGMKEMEGAMTFGVLVAFIEYLNKIFVPIKDLSAKFSVIQAAMAAMERIFSLIDTEPDIKEPSAPLMMKEISGKIEFNNVSFSYGRGKVINNLSFCVDAGEKVALVGATGAGKSTIIKLLSRMYDVTEGNVLVDGMDIKKMSLGQLRKNVGMVPQDFFIFSGTIFDNISLGREEIDLNNVKVAAEKVMASRFIEKMPRRYYSEIKEKGVNLSMGQKQLLSLARVMAHDPKILVLDEATSSIDVATELYIQKGIRTLFEDRTSIIIAHRLSTIKDVDRIIVLHKGEIREEGRHNELLEKKGLYYRLYQLQYQDQESFNAA